MKSVKAIIIGIAAIIGQTFAIAQDNLTIVLKDGTELTGYISRQRPGEDFTFTTSRATVLLLQNEVKSIVDIDVRASTLSSEWQIWAEENDAYNGPDNAHTLVLSDIVTNNGSINHVRILERGAKVRYLELTPNTYNLKWDTIAVIKAEKRPKLMLSGVNRKYKLASGMEYEGQYIEEVPGQTMSLMRSNGVIEVFNTDDVMKDCRIKVNPNQSLVEQSDLIDVVQLNNGGIIKGVIFERNYSTGNAITNDYILIMQDNGSISSINMSDINEYRKEKNPQYNPIVDIELGEEQAAINRTVLSLLPVKEISGVVTMEIDSLKLDIPSDKAKTIIAEFKADNAKAQQYRLIQVRKFYDKKGKKFYYGYTFEDMVKSAILPKSVETSVNGISKMVFELPEKNEGLYGIYDPITYKVVIFRVLNLASVG